MELDDLYKRYAPVVHRRALSILGRETDAWDAVQEVFERLLVSSAQFRGEARPMTYVYQVTTNVCLNQLRMRTHREPASSDSAAHEPHLDEGPSEAAQFLKVLVQHLSERELQIATLYFVDELSQDEIADVLGLSRKTIGRELSEVRARALALAQLPSRSESP